MVPQQQGTTSLTRSNFGCSNDTDTSSSASSRGRRGLFSHALSQTDTFIHSQPNAGWATAGLRLPRPSQDALRTR